MQTYKPISRRNGKMPITFSLFFAIIITARIFLPIVNIMISGLAYEVLFVLWLASALLGYWNDLRFDGRMMFLFVFPFIYIVYILISNTLAGAIYVNDFLYFFNFCIPVYFLIIYSKTDPKKLYTLAMFGVLCLFTTSLTTIYYLKENYYYSKLISREGGEYLDLWSKNIANINVVSSSVIIIPLVIYILINYSGKTALKLFYLMILIVLSILVFEASFSLIILCTAIGIVLVLSKKKILNVIIIMSFVLIGLFKNDVMNYIISISGNFNPLYSQRLAEIALLILGKDAQGDLFNRFAIYSKSFQYFLDHPFLGLGTGEYFARSWVLGYHSELLDSLARYGLLMFIPITIYFAQIYKIIAQHIDDLRHNRILVTSYILFFLYAMVNILFTSASFAFALFVMLPSVNFMISAEKRLESQEINFGRGKSLVK